MKVEHRHFQILDSTNSWAKRNTLVLSKECLTLITTDEQTAGRGRLNRRWESMSRQNVLGTFCFFMKKMDPSINNIPQILAISAVKLLEELGFSPRLKWPNDILLSEKKVAGILCETTPVENEICVITGIGINVNVPLEAFQRIDRPATSLLVESKKNFDLTEIVERLGTLFANDLEVFLRDGFSPFFSMYVEKLSHSRGDEIRFHDGREIAAGVFHSIELDGSLNLCLASGEIKNFIAVELM